MQLAETSIRRPVFATVLSLMIMLIGAVSFNRLAVREYPKIDERNYCHHALRGRFQRGGGGSGHQNPGRFSGWH